ncbi:MAG: hypothetical protein ACK46X_02305 [Candidatus Sericytochromatia bacterium]
MSPRQGLTPVPPFAGRAAGWVPLVVTLWVSACAVAIFGYCVWALDRGLDHLDGSFYVLSAMHPDAIRLTTTAAHWFAAPLWSMSGGLVAFRAVGLGMLALSAGVLALGAARAFVASGLPDAGRRALAPTLALTLVGALLYGYAVKFEPSYNSLATAGVYLGMGLVLLVAGERSGWRLAVAHGMAGLGLGVAFLCKFSAGLAALGACLVVVVALGRATKERTLGVLLLLAGMVGSLAMMTAMYTSVGDALDSFRLGASVFRLAADESATARLMRNAVEMAELLRAVGASFGWPLVALGLFALTRQPWIALLGVAMAGYKIWTLGFWLGGMDRYWIQPIPLLACLLLFLLASVSAWSHSWKTATLAATLIGLPFCVAVGSTNPIPMQIMLSLAPWGALLGVMAYTEARAGAPQAPKLLMAALFSTVVACQVISAGLRAPYMLAHPLPDQRMPVEVGKLGSFRVDRDTQDLLGQLSSLASTGGLEPGRPFLGLYNVPGLALLLQGIPPTTPWLFNQASAEAVLTHVAPAIIRSATVAVTLAPDGSRPPMPRQLASFPDGYRLCGTVTVPYRQQRVEIWAPAR